LIARWQRAIRLRQWTGKEDSMHSVWFGEYLGTLVLILLGNGVNANVTLRKSYAADAGWMVVATGWAIAVLCGVLVAQAFGSSGRALEPSHLACQRRYYRRLFAPALASGLLNCSEPCRAPRLWPSTLPRTGDPPPIPRPSLASSVPVPPSSSPLANIASEVIGTMVLVVVVRGHLRLMAFLKRALQPESDHGSSQVSFGASASRSAELRDTPSIPARDLGPRLAHFLLPIPGKGSSNWGYAPIPIIGDLVGGALAGLLLRYAHL
jgi:glycerol uptake facilitator protein